MNDDKNKRPGKDDRRPPAQRIPRPGDHNPRQPLPGEGEAAPEPPRGPRRPGRE